MQWIPNHIKECERCYVKDHFPIHLDFCPEHSKEFEDLILNKKIGWISVKDRLPKNGSRVIVNCVEKHNYSDKGICTDNIMYIKYFENGTYYDGETMCYFPVGEVNKVSHWMPLPEPPEED